MTVMKATAVGVLAAMTCVMWVIALAMIVTIVAAPMGMLVGLFSLLPLLTMIILIVQ